MYVIYYILIWDKTFAYLDDLMRIQNRSRNAASF